MFNANRNSLLIAASRLEDKYVQYEIRTTERVNAFSDKVTREHRTVTQSGFARLLKTELSKFNSK